MNAFVLKLDPKAQSVQGLTYLGAPGCLSGSSIAVDSTGEPWIAGALDSAATQRTSDCDSIPDRNRGGIRQQIQRGFHAIAVFNLFRLRRWNCVRLLRLAYVAGTGAYRTTTGTQLAYIAKIDPSAPAISLNSILSAAQTLDYYRVGGDRCLAKCFESSAANGTRHIHTRHSVSGVLATTVAGVQVTFDGVAVPLLSVSAQEIDLVAPFELATKSTTTVQVQYNGVQSNSVQVAVNPTSVQILGVFNGDFTAELRVESGGSQVRYDSVFGGRWTNQSGEPGWPE